MSDEVLINGVRYVPANDQIRDTPVDVILQALWESYMGKGERWQDARFKLYFVLDDGPDDPDNCTSLQQLSVLIQEIAARPVAVDPITPEDGKGATDE